MGSQSTVVMRSIKKVQMHFLLPHSAWLVHAAAEFAERKIRIPRKKFRSEIALGEETKNRAM